MHKLNRGAAPECLSGYKHGINIWKDVTKSDRDEIRQELKNMQGKRCAYCECLIVANKRHIEHFRQRSVFAQGTFDWGNLFWSCNRRNSCGKHKDRLSADYDHRDLIKPDVDEPDCFFHFISDGTIAFRFGLSVEEQKRATETLRVFNLDQTHGSLRAMRHAATVGYEETGLAIADLVEQGAAIQDCLDFMADELLIIQDLPFCTAIRHTLLPPNLNFA